MTAYIFRRTLWLLPVMLVVVVFAALLLQVAPDALAGAEGQAVSGEVSALETLFASPVGVSFWSSRFGNSVRLITLALVIAGVFGLPLGGLAALRERARLAAVVQVFSSAAISLPGFLLAALALAAIAYWRSQTGAEQAPGGLASWALPAVVLALGILGYVAHLLRTALRQVMEQGYALGARAKGLAGRAVFTRHLLRNALIPVSGMLAPALSGLVASSFLVEAIFDFPGMGQAFVNAIIEGDRALVFAGVVLYALLAAFARLGADLLAAILDPRLRSGKG